MKEPLWILKPVVLAVHNAHLSRHGGASGIRDETLLESALARPQNLYAYKEPDICDLAASYAYGIIRNHPFIDGNKRSAFVVSVLFLKMNGYTLLASREEKVTMFIRLATNEVTEQELASRFKDKAIF